MDNIDCSKYPSIGPTSNAIISFRSRCIRGSPICLGLWHILGNEVYASARASNRQDSRYRRSNTPPNPVGSLFVLDCQHIDVCALGSNRQRWATPITYTQAWNAENLLSVVTNTVSGAKAYFYYNGDGARVKKVDVSGGVTTTTAYIGPIEVAITTTQRITRSYYFAGSTLVAMRVLTGTTGNTLYFMQSDHLGSSSLTTDSSGNVLARQYYYPYGQVRGGGGLPTDIGFTGQRAESSALGSLMFFNARFYSPVLGRFISADTIVPNPANPQAWNRYSYSYNNPIKYADPSGHGPCGGLFNLLLGLLGFLSCPTDPGPTVIIDPPCKDCGAQPLIDPRCEDCGAQPLIDPRCEDCEAQPLIDPRCEDCGAQPLIDPIPERRGPTVHASESGFGDLTDGEVNQIQDVVNQAGRPLAVIGSAARGERRNRGTDLPLGKGEEARSDIDYIIGHASKDYYIENGLYALLPDIDPEKGPNFGVPNPHVGPYIQFWPHEDPHFIPPA